MHGLSRILLLLIIFPAGILVSPAAPPREGARLGTNISGPADWATELPLVNVFTMSRPWISQKKGSPWGKGPALDLDPQGWVRRLEPDASAETFVCTIEGGHYPSGKFTLLFEGRGRFEFGNSVTAVEEHGPGHFTLQVDAARGPVSLRLVATDPADYVRNIRVILPGFAAHWREKPWNPTFLQRWQGMSCLRFMDLGCTNNSQLVSWKDRPTPADATFSHKGLPVEWMVDLCNQLQCDGWFCIPHQADDEYVRQMAVMVRDRLAPGLRAWIEYSNEVWNFQFGQTRHAGLQGQALGFAEKPWEAGWRFYAHRSVQIFSIWEQVFGGRDRLVRVLASQGSNPYVGRQILEFENAASHADALAIAPYFGFTVPADETKPINARVVEQWTVDQVLDHIEKVTLPGAFHDIRENQALAGRYGLRLVAYEAGQHLVGTGGAENRERLTALFHATNRHPRMGSIYGEYLRGWEAAGGDLICNFSSVCAWSKWGSWGLLEYQDQDPATSPKFQAVMRWARSRGQNVNTP